MTSSTSAPASLPPPSFIPLPSGVAVSRRELVLLLTSTLRSLGLEGTVAALIAESGVSGAHVQVEALLDHVRAGRWKEARRKLTSLRLPSLSRVDRLRLHLLLLSAAYLEMIEAALLRNEMPIEALECLQRRIGPTHRQMEKLLERREEEEQEEEEQEEDMDRESPAVTASSTLPSFSSSTSSPSSLFSWASVCTAALTPLSHAVKGGGGGGVPSLVDRLSCLLLLSDVKSLYESSGWDGSRGRGRVDLADRIAEWLPRDAAVAPHRLLELLDSALTLDIQQCPIHNYTGHPTIGAPAHTIDPTPPLTSLFQRHHSCTMSGLTETQRHPHIQTAKVPFTVKADVIFLSLCCMSLGVLPSVLLLPPRCVC